MLNNDSNKNVKVKDFFKSNIIINELEDILNFEPDTLIGIDKVSSDTLRDYNIKNIGDLAKISLENLPDVKEVPSSIIIK